MAIGVIGARAGCLRSSACRLLLLAVCLAGFGTARADVLPLTAAAESFAVGSHLSYLEDKTGALTLDDVRDGAAKNAFVPSRGAAPNFGFTRSVYWFRLDLDNRRSDVLNWFLECQYTLIDRIDAYLVHQDGFISHYRGGDLIPFAERPVKHRHTIFKLSIPPGQAATLFLRVQSESSMQMPLVLWTAQGLMANDHEKQYFAGIYYGIVAAMLLYNLLIWLSIRDINYLYYANYICGWILFQLSIDGFAFEYLWPAHPAWGNIATPFFIGYVYCAILLFSREFLQLKANMPRVDRIFKASGLYFVLVMLSALLLDYAFAIKAGTFGALAGAVLIFSTGAVSLAKGVGQAKYFMLAWSVLLLSILVYTLRTFGMLPQVFATEYGLPIGSALEVILLSFALAHRMRLLKLENERIQRSATEMLELNVQQRTAELNQALERLALVNAQLTGLSYTDGLTGVKNRSYFDKMLEAEWQRAARAAAPLALLMLDIDHFKRVNDTYGHLAGDDCLKQVARTVREVVRRPTDEVFRYGGEEFVVLLPNTDMQGALHIAEQVRQQIEALKILFDAHMIAITVSIGVASRVPGTTEAAEVLIAQADEAMYAAKHHGRNQVCAYTAAAEEPTALQANPAR